MASRFLLALLEEIEKCASIDDFSSSGLMAAVG
jgi:hypothetical protein